jgi:hypothetical protein
LASVRGSGAAGAGVWLVPGAEFVATAGSAAQTGELVTRMAARGARIPQIRCGRMEFWSSMGVTLLHGLRRKEVEISIATVLRLAGAFHRHAG